MPPSVLGSPRGLHAPAGRLLFFTFQWAGSLRGLVLGSQASGPAQWGTKRLKAQILTTWAAIHGLRLPSPASGVCLLR